MTQENIITTCILYKDYNIDTGSSLTMYHI